MKLKDYLKRHKMRIHEFAAIIGFQRTHLSAVMNYRKLAGKRLVQAIEYHTRGQVTAKDLAAPE